jgi:hypothetical protein
MAAKLQHNLNDEYSVQGLVKPGADLATILASGVKDIKNYSKKDIVIVWGGTNGVSRNETDKGLIQIRNFVYENIHTNVLAMSLPDRLDLEATSCVNQEIKVFNRKLCKHMKVSDCVSTLEMRFERDHYTRHGLHLNSKGKDHSVQLLRSAIKNIFNIRKAAPVSMNWKEMQERPLTGKQRKAIVKNVEVEEVNSDNCNRGNNNIVGTNHICLANAKQPSCNK